MGSKELKRPAVSDKKQRVYYLAVMKTVLELADMLNRKLEDMQERLEFLEYTMLPDDEDGAD